MDAHGPGEAESDLPEPDGTHDTGIEEHVREVLHSEGLVSLTVSLNSLYLGKSTFDVESVPTVAAALDRIADRLEPIIAAQPESGAVSKPWGNRLGKSIIEDIANSLARIANSLESLNEVVTGRFEVRLEAKLQQLRTITRVLVIVITLAFA